jgi:RNA-directed DNA polymerase
MAVCLEPILAKRFELYNQASYAYLKGRGIQSAIRQMLAFHQEGCGVILETDIVNFFGTVSIDKLQSMIFPILSDMTLVPLIEAALRMEIGNREDLPEEDWELFPDSTTGLPQGGYLSPLFSNVYLSSFDHRMLAADFHLIRYADDFVRHEARYVHGARAPAAGRRAASPSP